ncbi:uncharacterized protein LOC124454312 [Xenia sp. Carnegie-2017]|uniref:uncharacterized protein LOC124454312 n=1 Tax=Xenia sp. Carnegie-2017 TaxID=2897299 RepID=UPI001F03A411|nr:uncharacterized protein LOC124454312 [Xenia sp. Carnegie-2017]
MASEKNMSLWNGVLLCIINISLLICGITLNLVVILCIWRCSNLRKKLCYFTILVLSCFDLANLLSKRMASEKNMGLWNGVFLCIINISLLICGITLNSVVILCIWRCSQLRKKLCYFTILVLSCFDLANVSVTHTLIILSTAACLWKSNISLRITRSKLSTIFFELSTLSLLMLNIERFLALNFPFFHAKHVNRCRFLVLTICPGVLFALLTFFLFNHEKTINLILIVYLCISFFLISLFNYKMYRIAKAKKKLSGNILRNLTTASFGQNKRQFNDLKKVSTCIIVVVCYLLFGAIPCLGYVSTCLIMDVSCSDSRLFSPSLWIGSLSAMSSTMNCLIFFWKNSILRKEAIKMIRTLPQRIKN